MNKSMILLATLLVFGFAFAQANQPEGISNAIIGIRNLVCGLLPVVIIVAVLIAAILFAVGQLGSAESRAKFHGWAMNIVIGAITAVLVYVLAPWILGALMNTDALSCSTEVGAIVPS